MKSSLNNTDAARPVSDSPVVVPLLSLGIRKNEDHFVCAGFLSGETELTSATLREAKAISRPAI